MRSASRRCDSSLEYFLLHLAGQGWMACRGYETPWNVFIGCVAAVVVLVSWVILVPQQTAKTLWNISSGICIAAVKSGTIVCGREHWSCVHSNQLHRQRG